ncbi:MAG: thioredoxin family protein [Acidimicrobiia bacterium]|nr:thioredoxin family protein [Acidimicrobiia bacterium]
MKRSWFVLFMAVAGLAACQTGPPPPVVVIANSPGTLVPGDVRLLVGLLDAEGSPIGGEDLAATVRIYDPESNELVTTTQADFIWTVPNVRGLYVVRTSLDRPGIWGLAIEAGDMPATEPVGFVVADVAVVPVLGDVAPHSVTPTGSDFALSDISTDPEPLPRFYERSLHEVLGGGTPVVAVFSTPALCSTATCGPALDVVKDIAATDSESTFVHIEVYTNLDAQGARELELAPSVVEWGLPSEPWVFVMDGDGVIVASFEGALGSQELAEALVVAGS